MRGQAAYEGQEVTEEPPDEAAMLDRIRRQATEEVHFYLSAGRDMPPRVAETCLLIAEIDRLARLCAKPNF